jgi:hypothetical protein
MPEALAAAVIAIPVRPLPPPQSLTNISLPPGWVAAGHVKMGQRVHTDSSVTFTQIAPNLTDADWLQTPSTLTPESSRPRFTVTDHVEVYIALPAAQPTPETWIASPDLALLTSASKTQPLALHRRRYAPGQTVDLTGLSPVSLLIRPVRASFVYQAEDSSFAGAALTTSPSGYTGRSAVALPASSAPASSNTPPTGPSEQKPTLTYTIEVGVGSRYGLNFRYTTASHEPIVVEQQIITHEDRLLRTDTLTFPPLKNRETWSVLHTRTGSSINAGTYQIRLSPTSSSPLLILDSLEVE